MEIQLYVAYMQNLSSHLHNQLELHLKNVLKITFIF